MILKYTNLCQSKKKGKKGNSLKKKREKCREERTNHPSITIILNKEYLIQNIMVELYLPSSGICHNHAVIYGKSILRQTCNVPSLNLHWLSKGVCKRIISWCVNILRLKERDMRTRTENTISLWKQNYFFFENDQ